MCMSRAPIYPTDTCSMSLQVTWTSDIDRGYSRTIDYIVAVEHDLSILDYLSDFVCCLYGKPSVYGVVTMPYSVRGGAQTNTFTTHLLTSSAGISIFLDGFIPTENLRFREESLSFKMVETAEEELVDKTRHYSNLSMTTPQQKRRPFSN